MSHERIIGLLHDSARGNRENPLRAGQVVHLPTRGDLICAGDLHNHARNFERIIHAAALECHPERHLVLQELIHGGPLGLKGEDTSFDFLVHALTYAQRFTGRVHILLANHDLAQVHKIAIMKDGYDLTERFNRNLKVRYGIAAPQIEAALKDWVYSLPLAAITVTGIFFSHSLPAARDLPAFDQSVLRRRLTESDYQRGGDVYKLVWGRNQTTDSLVKLGRLWWTDLFVCGHQTQDAGWGTINPNMLIVDSSHNHGTILQINFQRQYALSDLVASLTPLAAIA
jgi:hypothetical protein